METLRLNKSNLSQNAIHIVCVVNNFDLFNKVISNNINVNHYPVTIFDNTSNNISITQRYNSFIEKNIKSDSDFWIIFCHQDFGFMEDPYVKIANLDRNHIYGAIGAKLKRGLYIRNSKIFTYKRFCLGQIHWENSNDSQVFGIKLRKHVTVDTLDCCCIIVHSSLINKYNLKFDENLDFHMYAEEFCINSRKHNKIETKAAQFKCYHFGRGTIDDNFYRSVNYVRKKHNLKSVISVCTGHADI